MIWPFSRKPSVDELAALRDRALVAETQVLLLRDMVEHPKRLREPRKDAARIKEKKAATTARLLASTYQQGRG